MINNGRWSTTNLWLVGLDADGTRVTDLQEAAGKAVAVCLRKKTPRGERAYATSFRADSVASEGKAAATPFKGRTLRIPFYSEVPKSADAPAYAGDVTVGLPQGNVLGVANVKAQ